MLYACVIDTENTQHTLSDEQWKAFTDDIFLAINATGLKAKLAAHPRILQFGLFVVYANDEEQAAKLRQRVAEISRKYQHYILWGICGMGDINASTSCGESIVMKES